MRGHKLGEGVHDEVSKGHKKHLTCLPTDVAGAVEDKIP